MPNRLATETSPYLRQHAENPVDWFPFGKDAFSTAASLDRPILLSIGYSACHWCHVMAHESFEDEETAALMNARYVNIKVDREELPDVDQIYQRALALQGESGGWPLTMFLTPSGVPFFGGTYFPPAERYGRPSFRRVLTALSDAWQREREKIVEQSQQYKAGLVDLAARELASEGDAAISDARLERAIAGLGERVDEEHGGFGGAPKFPNASALRLLLRGARRAQRRGSDGGEALRRGFLTTLDKMAAGGIYDQVGGGFARYSTDAVWLVPHFEKMLYDNAQLLTIYAEGYQLGADPAYARVLRGTVAWIEREMRAPEGGLYTALDADSEGLEGRFYVWTWPELGAVLSGEELALAQRLLGAREEGNWRDPHGHSPAGANVLSRVATPQSSDEHAALERVLGKLFAARSPRVRPGTDDKILASVNGLAIAGLAEAGRVLGDPAIVESARRTADFVLARLRDPRSGRLFRTWKDGAARLPGTLDDHAFVADGLFALYEASGERRWFDEGLALLHLAIALFWDDKDAAFYLVAADEPELPALIERPISGHDGAIPAGASVLIERLLTVGEAGDDKRLVEIATRAISRRAARALEQPFAYAHLLGAVDTLLESPSQIVVTGAGPERDALLRAIAGAFVPGRLIVRTENVPPTLRMLVADKHSDGAAAFICRSQRCEAPLRDPAQLAAALR